MKDEQKEVVIFLLGAGTAGALIGCLLVLRVIFVGWEGLMKP